MVEFGNRREVYGNNGNFISARSYDYFSAIDDSNNKLSIYKLGLDDNKIPYQQSPQMRLSSHPISMTR